MVLHPKVISGGRTFEPSGFVTEESDDLQNGC